MKKSQHTTKGKHHKLKRYLQKLVQAVRLDNTNKGLACSDGIRTGLKTRRIKLITSTKSADVDCPSACY